MQRLAEWPGLALLLAAALAAACEVGSEPDGGETRRESAAPPAALVLASDQGRIEIDPERFALRLLDRDGRLLAQQAGFGLGFEHDGQKQRVRRVLESARLDSGRGLVLRVE